MKASRLLSILMTLQARGRRTADQLADELEVSPRTIHRDVDELSAAGVPIYAERGRQGGFRLLEGYQTKLTGLDADEASVLMLSGIGSALDDLGLTDALSQTERKLMAALPEATRGKAALVADRFHLDPFSWYRKKEGAPFAIAIAQAVWTDQRISIHYESWKGPIERDLDAIAVVLKAGDWYLIGRAQTMRVYKIANIQSVSLLDSKFDRPTDFNVSQFWEEWITSFEIHIRGNRARLRVTQKGQKLLKDMGRSPIAYFDVPDQPDVTDIELAVEGEANTVRQILYLGAEAEVIAPETLRLAVQNEVAKIAKSYCD
jgi:predicted DNA-binding transcriptional regulator YafY